MRDDADVGEELQRALAEAFPSRESLRVLLKGEFGADVAADVPDDAAVYGYASNLVQWASSRGRRDELLLAALKAHKYNQRLLRLVERLGLEPARAGQHGEFRPLGPSGVLVRALAVQPGESPTLYAGAWGQQGVFRSDNGGLLWRPKSKGLTDLNINYIALSPHDERVFAATDSGVCVSYNRGDSWEPLKDDFTKSRVMFVLLSPSEPGFFMAGTLVSSSGTSVGSGTAGLFSEGERELSLSLGVTPGRLHVSRDAGESWASADLKNPNHAAFCPSDARVIYVASGDNGLFKITLSQNIGIEFIQSFPTNSQPIYVAVCPTDAGRLAVGTRHGLYLSDDGGGSWRAAEGIGTAQVSGITFHPGGEALLVSSSEGVFESLDGGKQWSRARGDSFFPWCMALAQTDDGAVFVGTSGMGVYRRARGQKDWSPRNDGFPPAGGWLSAVATPSGATYVGGVYGLYRSLDEGHSWDMLGFDDDAVTVMAVGPAAPAQAPRPAPAGGLLVSSDGGLTVRPLDAQQREILYVGTASGRVLRRSHTGSSWEQLFDGVPDKRQYPVRSLSHGHVRELFVTGDGASELYALLGMAGLFHSRDAGGSWSRLGEQVFPPGLNTLHVSAHVAGRVMVGYVGERSEEVRGGILWSEDAGQTWDDSAGVSGAVTSICESAQPPGRIYATTTSRAVYRSSDGGRSFEQLRAPEQKVFRWVTVLVCPDDESVIWLGSSEGMLRSRDGGKTWELLDGGLIGETYYVNRLSYSRGWLYAAMKDGAFKTAARS